MNFDQMIAERSSKKIYRDGNNVVKIFDEKFSKSDILNEALNLARVEETGLPTPKVVEVTKIDGKWAIVMTFLQGETITNLISKNPEKTDEYLEKFVDIQLEIHNHKVPLLNKLKDKMNTKISQTDLDATTRYELHTRLESMPKHKKLCHGDFNPSNVLLNDDGSYGILDWSHATQGNASADAARTYLLFHLKGQIDLAEKYLDLFCQKSDTAKQYVQKWLPIVAASQSIKGKPEEKDLLIKWASVVEYE
ncbi:phosphotransferase family protein [Scatolibacter rhodanostii]|uniref:phosphotransferase family protein n=1 Tax=Scatolibacter rhodanostii TaxID=2014781 RepID=UPI000C06E932|nr:aminoglycoside phosphotransferase family protein [Scatolibacter rhodanostii]